MSQPVTGHELEAENTAEMLSVAQVSAALNLSEKTVRKRIKTGEIEALRVPLDKGGAAFRVPRRAVYGLGASIETEAERNIGQTGTEGKTTRNGSETEDLERSRAKTEGETETKRNFVEPETEASEPASVSDSAPSQWQQRETDFRDEIKFLRGLVEQRDRDAAELRSALRAALDNAPKQLMQGTSNSVEAPISLAKPPDEPTPGTPAKTPQNGGNRPQSAPRAARPLWKLILGIR
jgi:excisionase family DNA binding protein